MLIPLQWLAEYVDISVPVDELAHLLTMSGLNVEAITQLGADWQDVVAGRVTTIDPHPASRNPLQVAEVDLGERRVTIVTGAQNVRQGDMVPMVLVGGVLPHGPDGGPMKILPRPMAGITSEGMLASARELGISDEHAGIYILPPDTTVGETLQRLMGDTVFDLETQPNRPDTLSIVGVAREVAALTGQHLRFPETGNWRDRFEILDEESFDLDIQAPDLCPRYTALRVEGVSGGFSPAWMTRRLEAAGMRAVGLLVDVTNYVMLELGQPMHAFDASRLRGGRIEVRRARAGESLVTLDGATRTLNLANLVIADAERAVAIAGVMGGVNSEIADSTASVVLESANFDPVSVRRTAQTLALRTEASTRFEKRLPPELTMIAAQRFAQLLGASDRGRLGLARASDRWIGAPAPTTVRMPLRDLHRLVGIPIPLTEAAGTLRALSFDVTEEPEAVSVDVPYWRRVDIRRSEDVVEEVIRLVGYDRLPASLPRHIAAPPQPLTELVWQDRIRERLLGSGVSEVVTDTLTSMNSAGKLYAAGHDQRPDDACEFWSRLVVNPEGVESRGAETRHLVLRNPPAKDRDMPRLTLLPSLLEVLSRNAKHTAENLAFFELAKTFFERADELPYERRTLTLALAGLCRPRSWQMPAPAHFTFFDIKGLVAAVLDTVHISDWETQRATHPALHPGRSAVIVVRGGPVAYLGELDPRVAEAFELGPAPVQVAEVDLDTLLSCAHDEGGFVPLPRYPAALRDIAVLVPESVPAGAILRTVQSTGGTMVSSSRIFDVYNGDPLPTGFKSVAIEMELRSSDATLSQQQIGDVMEQIVRTLASDLGATLRE